MRVHGSHGTEEGGRSPSSAEARGLGGSPSHPATHGTSEGGHSSSSAEARWPEGSPSHPATHEKHGTRREVAGSSRLAFYTIAALVGFSSNSLLTRVALEADTIDASTFMAVRIGSGAATLALLAGGRGTLAAGSMGSAAALAAYALAFTFAYVRIGAGIGALLLFGSVQATMIAWGLWRGERPGLADWIGLALAMAGLVLLTAPGISAPDAYGAALMITAGIAWGVYSLRGRRATMPLAATAGNFVWAFPMVAAIWIATLAHAHISWRGMVLALTSGSLASGLAYTLWYAALPRLTAWRAAVVQLSVPVVTAMAATILLGEALTARLLVAGALIITGVLLPVAHRGR